MGIQPLQTDKSLLTLSIPLKDEFSADWKKKKKQMLKRNINENSKIYLYTPHTLNFAV